MKVYIFLYNVVAIKAHLDQLSFEKGSKKVFIGSDYAIDKLSDENRFLFDDIYSITRNFHQVIFDEVEFILKKYLDICDPEDIYLLSNEDSTQLTCARLREKYNIPGYDVAQLTTYVNKDVSKDRLAGNIRIPKFMLFDKKKFLTNPHTYIENVVRKIGLPIFIKPIDLVSSMGTYHIKKVSDLEKILNDISQQPWQFEIDEFIDGDLYHCDLIVFNDEISFFSVGAYANPLAQFSKGYPMGSIPVIDKELNIRLLEFCKKTLSYLGSMSSAFHIEVFKEKMSGDFVFLEAAARTPGALVPEMYEIIYETHLELMHYQVQLEDNINFIKSEKTVFAGWITYPKIYGEVLDIDYPKLNLQHQFMALVHAGEHLNQAETLLDSACSIVFWGENYEEITNTFKELKAFHPLIMKGSSS